ncbi:MAG: alpha-2-macroglobulin family protein, partial [Planctomycetota bacterium]
MPRHIAIRALLFIACALVPACSSGPTDYEAHGPGDGAVWDAASGLDEIRRRYNEARVLYDDRRYDDAIRSLESALVIAHELQGRADTSAQVRYINGLIDQAQRLARTRRQEELRYTVLLSEQIREVERAVQRGDRGGSIDNGANTVPPGQAIAGLFFNQGGAGSNRVSGSRFDNIFETTIGSLMRDGAAGATPAPTHEPVTRKEFPESMLVAPMLITDADGRVTIGVERMPDAITTWKVRAIAHSIDGAFGEGSGTFRVFRDLFLNLQLPRVLTVGDELYVPLTVMNYGPATIDVVVSVQRESCLELDADGSYAFAVESKSANKQYARMKMLEPGEHTVTVTARAGEASDRVQLPLRVEPPGIHRTTVQRIRVAGDQQLDVRFPAAAPPDASEDLARQLESRAHREVELRVSPGTLSDLLLARAGLLQRPTGCLEQTLSTTLVDVEIARVYAQIGDAAVDELEHAREILQLAWQRLLAFYNGDQHRFSMWPGDDARSSDRWLDAWALLAIRGMQAVGVVVDPEFVDRLAAGLAQSLESMDGPTCAIAMWALLEGGHAHTKWPEVDA